MRWELGDRRQQTGKLFLKTAMIYELKQVAAVAVERVAMR